MSASPGTSTSDDQFLLSLWSKMSTGNEGSRNEGAPVDIPSTSGPFGLDNNRPDPISFTFLQLDKGTRNFNDSCIAGVSPLGPVFRCKIPPSDELVAVKRLIRIATLQGHTEFLVEILMLSVLHHPNIINLIGYCSESDERLIVYEDMHRESLLKHLHDRSRARPLNWNTRMQIAFGAAKAFEFLHTKAEPVVIHRNVKPSNILLAMNFKPKLSGFGHAIFGNENRKAQVFSQKKVPNIGYSAPETETGVFSTKSDVYGFGVLLLEIVTGVRARNEPNGVSLLDWANQCLKDHVYSPSRKYTTLADPEMEGKYREEDLKKVIDLALRCVSEKANRRPSMSVVVSCLEEVVSVPYESTDATSNDERWHRQVLKSARGQRP